MIVLSRNVSIPDNELEITAIRAQGAGGQHVNKTSTAIHLRFDIRASSLPEYYKERLLAASHHLISGDGIIIIKAQEYRSRAQSGSGNLPTGGGDKELTAVQKKPTGNSPYARLERAQVVIEGAKSTVKALRGRVRRTQD